MKEYLDWLKEWKENDKEFEGIPLKEFLDYLIRKKILKKWEAIYGNDKRFMIEFE